MSADTEDEKEKTWNMFVAAMLHDIGKLNLKENGRWDKHDDLEYLGESIFGDKNYFTTLLGADVIGLIREHHSPLHVGESADLTSLKIADGLQKAIHDIEIKDEFDKLNAQFRPFYGYPEEWEPHKAKDIMKKICKNIEDNKITTKTLLKIQKELITYPHTRYIPHISLAIHQRLSAVISIFLSEKLKKKSFKEREGFIELEDFKFYVFQITPDQIQLVYRLRDIIAQKNITDRLDTQIFRRLFLNYSPILRGINPKNNPFVFYHGDGLVFMHDSYEEVIKSLKEILNSIPELRNIDVKVHEYTIPMRFEELQDKSGYKPFIEPLDVKQEIQEFTILSDNLITFDKTSSKKCSFCGKPRSNEELLQDSKGNVLCNQCDTLRRNSSSGIDFDEIAKSGDGERLVFSFVSLPDDLLSHSKQIADEKLIVPVVNKNMLTPGSIHSSRLGLMEFLQVLYEIERFQETLQEVTKRLRDIEKGGNSAFAVYELPTNMLYLVREDIFWDKFIGRLKEERFELKLDSSLKMMLCRPKAPLWSLISKVGTYSEGDEFYDITGGVITMFNSKEVDMIRRLAQQAKDNRVFPTQIEKISEVALRTTKKELLLEIEIRKDRLRNFGKELSNGLEQLELSGKDSNPDDELNKEKRAIFIKYISKLTRR